MAIAPIFKKACWSLAIAGGLYFAFISLLLNGWIQRQAFYAHNVHTAWWQDPNKPEQFGFLKNQVQRFDIKTPDGEILWGWHVLPLTLYAENERALIKQSFEPGDYKESLALKLLAQDPESRLIIYFHGNAGTVAQGWRTDTYRAITSGASSKVHVLTIDYRGYGKSTGSPTEAGLIIDGVSFMKYAMEVARIPPERIVIVGQSLGTAVATAVVEHFALEHAVEFKCLILCAAFSDVPTLMSTYTVGGLIPILSPLRPYPFLSQFFAKRIQETWFTSARLANLVRKSKNVNVHLIHATNDYDIPWSHSDTLFRAAANATSVEGLTFKQIDAVKMNYNLDESGWTNIWKAVQEDGGRKVIRQDIVKHGGHNRVVTYPVVAKAVLDAFYTESQSR